MLLRMPADEDPPRKFFQLKPKDFERVNDSPVAPADGPIAAPASGSANADAAAPPQRIDVRDLVKQGAGTAPLLGVNAVQNRANEVHAMLRENVAHDNAAGLNQLAPKPKHRSRRKRDYWLLFFTVNAFFAFMAFGPYSNPVSLIYGVAGIIFFTCGVTWVMWFVMDDY